MRSGKIVPIGQGCKPYTKREAAKGNFVEGMCKQHFWLYLNICLGCGEQFHTHRPHTKTCSDRCRQRLSRTNRFDKTFQMVMQFAGGE
jgi:predicted nucleic acid-binding Zn ribbon protein